VYAPKDPGSGLAEYEVKAILEYKQEHPSYGPAQIRAQLKRFKGWRLSNKAINKVLREHGYESVHRGSRPEGPEPIRFEAPRRNALWQMDFTEFRIDAQRIFLLVILDDFSRFIVGHEFSDSPTSTVAIGALQCAMARHGRPESVRTDRGGAFNSGEFKKALEAELIDHVMGHSYHPQGGGKVESVIGTIKRELWDIEHFVDLKEAEQRVVEFCCQYNEQRAHMGIDGLTPADRYFGKADKVLDVVNAISRRRNESLQRQMPALAVVEENGLGSRKGPLEVLRLMIVDEKLEFRFCGARVNLGRLKLQS